MKIISFILLFTAGAYLFYYFSDKEIIKRDLEHLATEISKEEQETSIQMVLNLKKIKAKLANPCHVTVTGRDIMPPLETDLIIRYLMAYRQQYRKITLTFEDTDIIITDTKKALVHTTVHLKRYRKTDQTEAIPEREALELTLSKKDKKWQIKKVTIPNNIVEYTEK